MSSPRFGKARALGPAFLVLCFLAGPAWAQQQGAQTPAGQSVRQACAADFHQYCSGVQPGGGRIIACLQQNSDKLSQGCQQALATAKAARQGGSGN